MVSTSHGPKQDLGASLCLAIIFSDRERNAIPHMGKLGIYLVLSNIYSHLIRIERYLHEYLS